MTKKTSQTRKKLAAAAGVLMTLTAGVALSGALTAPAEAASCGATVSYGDWYNANGVLFRDWTWKYRNCSSETEHVKVNVGNYPDSKCFSVGARGGTANYGGHESKTPHANYYRSTDDC